MLELHGNLALVRCLDCGEATFRTESDGRMCEANPGFDAIAVDIRPDGDLVLS